MRLKSVFISEYKNLKDFTISFQTDGFLDIFVGKNGSGKSNFLEALIQIFDHIYGVKPSEQGPEFDYKIIYEIEGTDTCFSWKDSQFQINGKSRKILGKTPVPDNIIVYYSGQNNTVSNLIRRYRTAYRRKVKGSTVVENPRFIGIGPDYKQLMLAIMLMLPEDTLAREYSCNKLGVEGAGEIATIKLRKPYFAKKTKNYDPFNDEDAFWGVKGIARNFIDNLLMCIKGSFSPGSLYDRETGQYELRVDVELFREQFADTDNDEVFCQFTAIRALDMLEEVSIPIRLATGTVVTTRDFSDGQFQSIYIFAISELFKDQQCLTFLDEPDSFLHPEWQFQFLDQVSKISQQAAKTNHILMTSHSASTIAAKVDVAIHAFELDGEEVKTCKRDKGDLIKSLSAGLITFSEKEARLSISNILKNSARAMLFTEGVSEEIILGIAWSKLNKKAERPFDIQGAFGCSFLRVLLLDPPLYTNHPDKIFFGLFDFDEAYNSWNLKDEKSDNIEDNPERCLVKKKKDCEGYFMLLPVPQNLTIRDQIINPKNGQHYKSNSRLDIELLFHDVPDLRDYFEVDPTRPGNSIRFKGKKTQFAKNIVPELDAKYFEVFRPIFDFIQSKVSTDNTRG